MMPVTGFAALCWLSGTLVSRLSAFFRSLARLTRLQWSVQCRSPLAGQFYQRGLRVMFKASLLGLGGSLALRAR
jgi:hypothetical protein